jgi:phosphoglycerol transferase
VTRTVGLLIDEVTGFLDHIRAEQAATGRDLRIVLLSDHLNHTATLPKAGEGFAGFNTVILCGDPQRRGEVIDKPGSMVDVFPTLLDWLGWSDAAAAGLGRSLLSDAPTLVEEFGIAALDRMVTGDAGFSKLVWAEAPRLAETPVLAETPGTA